MSRESWEIKGKRGRKEEEERWRDFLRMSCAFGGVGAKRGVSSPLNTHTDTHAHTHPEHPEHPPPVSPPSTRHTLCHLSTPPPPPLFLLLPFPLLLLLLLLLLCSSSSSFSP